MRNTSTKKSQSLPPTNIVEFPLVRKMAQPACDPFDINSFITGNQEGFSAHATPYGIEFKGPDGVTAWMLIRAA